MKRIKCLIKTILPVLLTFSVLALAACTNAIDSGSSNDEKKKPSKPEEELLPYTVVDTVEINEKAYEIVTFGSWPQALIEDGVQITEETKDAGYFTSYYKGDDGEWYAELNGSYFKVMPIRWRILTKDYNGNKLLLAENSLINILFYDVPSKSVRKIGEEELLPSNYEYSKIRAFLTGIPYDNEGTSSSIFDGCGFFQTAFSPKEQEAIVETSIDDGSDSGVVLKDMCFLLSRTEATASEYGFNTTANTPDVNRIRHPTDYAVASGTLADSDPEKGAVWWLRSIGTRNIKYVSQVNVSGGVGNGVAVDYVSSGLVPALCLKK